MAIVKTWVSAIPTVDATTGNVIRWELTKKYVDGDYEVEFSHTAEAADLDGEELFPLKLPVAFTLPELDAMFPDANFETVYTSMKTSVEAPPTENTVNDFDYTTLSVL